MDKRKEYAEAKSRMVRQLLAHGYDLFQIPPHDMIEGQKRWKHCMDKVDFWFIENEHSPLTLRKPISDMTHDELTKAVTIFRKVQRNFLKQL